jgi:hypothetical protein
MIVILSNYFFNRAYFFYISLGLVADKNDFACRYNIISFVFKNPSSSPLTLIPEPCVPRRLVAS